MTEEYRPTIICLCGSSRFAQEFVEANYCETLAGKIVLSIGVYPHGQRGEGVTDALKKKLDELHKRKIDLADEVLFLDALRAYCPKCSQWQDVGFCMACGEVTEYRPYMGDSTKSELDYARGQGKKLRFLSRERLVLPNS